MKVMILLDSLEVGGGAERVSSVIGNELHSLEVEIHYLTFLDKNPKYEFKGGYHTLDHGIEDQIKDSGNILKRGYNFLKNSGRIATYCKELEIVTLISVGEVANFHAVLSRMLYSNPARIIISQHINPLIHFRHKLKVQMINFFYSQADKTVCVSKEIEEILNNNFNVKNTITIYNMVDQEEIKSSSQEMTEIDKKFTDALDEGKSIFINVGSLFRQKGHWFLIRSFRKVVDQHQDSKLFILGEGPLREKLENLIEELNLKNHVFLLGNKANVFPYLKNSCCFVFSSLWEGLPMTLIEALSLDLPIISTDCMTGPREVLCPELDTKEEISYPYHGKYGILSHPFHNKLLIENLEEHPLSRAEEIMADLMIEIIENLKLRKRYSNGKEMARNFDKYKIIKEWEYLLN